MLNSIIAPAARNVARFAGPPAAQGARYAIMVLSGTVVTYGTIAVAGLGTAGVYFGGRTAVRGIRRGSNWAYNHRPFQGTVIIPPMAASLWNGADHTEAEHIPAHV